MKEKFTELLCENQGIIHKICNLYFRDRFEKEDDHQELIIQLWKAFPSFNNTAKFSTWMYRVCINDAIDIKRKEKKQLKYVELSEVKPQNMSLNGDTNYTNQEKLYEAIRRLSDVDSLYLLFSGRISYFFFLIKWEYYNSFASVN